MTVPGRQCTCEQLRREDQQALCPFPQDPELQPAALHPRPRLPRAAVPASAVSTGHPALGDRGSAEHSFPAGLSTVPGPSTSPTVTSPAPSLAGWEEGALAFPSSRPGPHGAPWESRQALSSYLFTCKWDPGYLPVIQHVCEAWSRCFEDPCFAVGPSGFRGARPPQGHPAPASWELRARLTDSCQTAILQSAFRVSSLQRRSISGHH